MIGLIVTSLLTSAEEQPSRRAFVLLILVAGFVVTAAAVGYLTAPMRAVLPWWSIVFANAVAVVLAGIWLVRRRPGLWHVFGGTRGHFDGGAPARS